MENTKFFGTGPTTSDANILKTEILRQIVYLRAEELMVFKNALPLESMDSLEIKLTMPKLRRFDAEEVAEGALSSYQMMTWFDVTANLKKEQIRILVTDESKARMQADIQTRQSIEAAARGLAWSKDTDIKSTLVTGAGYSFAAGEHWHTAASTSPAKMADDISAAIENILTNTYLTESDLDSLNVFYPQGLVGYMMRPMNHGFYPNTTVKGFIEQNYGVHFYPTRQLTTSALVVLNTPETGMHITYSGSAIPTSETQRIIGTGEQYVLTQLFKTFIMPESEPTTPSTAATNERVVVITGVA
jgi:hypothetical protein